MKNLRYRIRYAEHINCKHEQCFSKVWDDENLETKITCCGHCGCCSCWSWRCYYCRGVKIDEIRRKVMFWQR